MNAFPLKKRRLLSIVFVSARLLLCADIGYLARYFRLMDLSSIDIRDIASLIELSGWFSSIG